MVTVLVVGAVRENGEETSAVATPADQLQQAVVAMYGAIADRDYASAYSYRSDTCKTALTSDAFTAAITEIYTGRNLSAGRPSYSAQLNGASAEVVFKYNDIDNDPDAETGRTWTLTSQGWRFDNCR
ncbi:hypothetical protein ACFWF7_05655 [Nocardia sp. NPDC060256]|uniref:hypothetical protein n=1 Tax=unclassified Nocardia TaxID=2637762 RepID=UPI00364B235A